MSMREEWSPAEIKFKELIRDVKKEYPDFWNEKGETDLSFLPPIKQQQKMRKHTLLMVPAAVVVIFIVGSLMAVWINSDSAYAVKFKIEKMYYSLRGMIETNDQDDDFDDTTMTFKTVNEENIGDMKKFWDELLIPYYVPADYKFLLLEIQKSIHGKVRATYEYQDENTAEIFSIIMINDSPEWSQTIWTEGEVIEQEGRTIYLWADTVTGISGAKVNAQGMIIHIRGNLGKEEIINIIASLKSSD